MKWSWKSVILSWITLHESCHLNLPCSSRRWKSPWWTAKSLPRPGKLPERRSCSRAPSLRSKEPKSWTAVERRLHVRFRSRSGYATMSLVSHTVITAYCDSGYCDKLTAYNRFCQPIWIQNVNFILLNHLFLLFLWHFVFVTIFCGPNSVTICGKHCIPRRIITIRFVGHRGRDNIFMN